MDSGNGHQEPYRTNSFSRESSLGSSLSLSRSVPALFITNDVDSESASEAGDIGDRSLRRRHSSGRSNRLFSFEDLLEQGVTDDTSRQEQGSVIKPLLEHMTTSPLPTKSLLSPETNNPVKKEEPVLSKSLEYISCLIHLAGCFWNSWGYYEIFAAETVWTKCCSSNQRWEHLVS